MIRFLLLAALFSAALLGLSHSAHAQFADPYGYTGFVYYRPAPVETAHYDSSLDPKLVRAASIADSKSHPKSTLRCWQYVKQALVASGAVQSYPSSNYACQAGWELKNRFGFVLLNVRDPYHAPVGAVIVYNGHGAGHVELRTAHGFASDYHSHYACRYNVSGIYAKLAS